MLRRFTGLAFSLGFESPEIHELLRNGDNQESPARPASTKPALVTSRPGETLQRRYRMPVLNTFREDRKFLFLPYLHDNQVEHGEGITSFFMLKAIYLTFLSPPEAKIALFPLQERDQREQRKREQREHWEREQRQQREQEQQARLEQVRREQELREQQEL